MIKANLKLKGMPQVQNNLKSKRRKIRRKIEDMFKNFAAPLVLNQAKNELSRIANKWTGKLARSFWKKTKRSSNKVILEMGWDYYYGSVLEFGPAKVRTWTIYPRKKKILRFTVGDKVVFARKVTQHWSDKRLRMHFKPALDKTWSMIENNIAMAMVD